MQAEAGREVGPRSPLYKFATGKPLLIEARMGR